MTAEIFTKQFIEAKPRLMAIALGRSRNVLKAEELVSVVYSKALTKINLYKSDRPMINWLASILINTYKDMRKRTETRTTTSLNQLSLLHKEEFSLEDIYKDPSQREPLESMIVSEKVSSVQSFLSRMRPEYAAVLKCVVMNGASYQEAADELGCPVGTIRSRLVRARKTILRSPLRYQCTEQ